MYLFNICSSSSMNLKAFKLCSCAFLKVFHFHKPLQAVEWRVNQENDAAVGFFRYYGAEMERYWYDYKWDVHEFR